MSKCCDFCGQIAGDREHNALLALVGRGWAERPVLVEHGEAVLMPSIGALRRGHVLVCPKEHARSIAAASPTAAADVETLADACGARLEEATGSPIHAFEHGSSATLGGRIACSVEHAHLHLVPADVEIRQQLQEKLDWESVDAGIGAIRDAAAGREYLFYQAPDGERMLACTESGFPSQFIRIVLAEALGRAESWNWREHPARPEVEGTASLFLGSLVGSGA